MSFAGFDHETLLVRRGRRTGVYTIIAVHSTALGPALGGARMWRYRTLEEAVADAVRLSAAMTLKAAAAGLALGGGKGVISLANGELPVGLLRRNVLRDFADAVNALEGNYITAEDVGTTSSDMAVLAEATEHVVGRPSQDGGSGDPGAYTAAGVEAAMRACAHEAFGSAELAGRSVAIVGVGSVGERLARSLTRAGASLVLSDINATKAGLAGELSARWLQPELAVRAPVDVLALCALGGVIDDRLAAELRCRIVCGAANNQLAEDGVADRLAERGILYAPDFIVNAGGLINVALERTAYDAGVAVRRAEDIEAVLGRVLAHAARAGVTPLTAATELAQRRLSVATRAHRGRLDRLRAGAPS